MNKFKIITFLFFLMGAGSVLSLILSTIFRVTNCNKICQNSFSEGCFNCRENANPFGGDGTFGKVAITIFAISFVGFATSGFLASCQHEIRINEGILRQDQTAVNDIELENQGHEVIEVEETSASWSSCWKLFPFSTRLQGRQLHYQIAHSPTNLFQ